MAAAMLRSRKLLTEGCPSAKIILRYNGSRASAGLFGNRLLVSPEGFQALTESTLKSSRALVQDVLRSGDSLETLRLFDELSDSLCRAADLAECIRLLHPKAEFVKQAELCCTVLGSYVEELNTNKDLYNSLKSIKYDGLDEVSTRHASLLLHDFEISGIHLNDKRRSQIVQLNQLILSLCHAFMYQCSEPFKIKLNEVPQVLRDNAHLFALNKDNTLLINHVPFSNENESLRKQCYLYYHSPHHSNKLVLDQLLAIRHELALVTGYKTFAHRTLKDTMAGSPERVMEFLDCLNEHLLPLAKEEVNEMTSIKGSELYPWDYSVIFQRAKDKLIGSSINISSYFTLESCLDGIGNLFNELFGVQMVSDQPLFGETWQESVAKYTFLQGSEVVGHLYCDWYSRADKTAADCQFTIQGSRLCRNGKYQLPISTLSLDLPPDKPHLLSHQHVHNIFHEMGHAIHSLLGRSPYQNTSGTRCPTDYAEVPSNLMELFLQDPRVLCSFAKHYKTHEPITPAAINQFQLSSNLYPAFTAQQQILYSVMDQEFHGTHPLGESTIELYARLHDRYSPVNHTPNTAWFLRFSHLYMYGAKYYSYLWSRSVANLIWRKCFHEDPFSCAQGEIYHKMMLAHGGGIHPSKLVKNMIGYEPTVTELVEACYEEIVDIKNRQ